MSFIFIRSQFMKDHHDTLTAIKLSLVNYKHSDPSRPADILVYRDKPVCPVFHLLEFLAIRGTAAGPLFCWPDNTPVHRAYFTRVLKDALRFCDLDLTRYKTHSFRIGAASWAAAKGMSDTQIRLFGRWKSNAFLRYIRMPHIGPSVTTWVTLARCPFGRFSPISKLIPLLDLFSE